MDKKSKQEWKKVLPPKVYEILWEKETEPPNSGKYADFFAKGTYFCSGCKVALFESKAKFASSSGWPSFDHEIKEATLKKEDNSHGMHRIEVLCANCHGHLGHLFDDGPTQSSLRYCINSLSLEFKP